MGRHALEVESSDDSTADVTAQLEGADAAASGFDPASLHFVTRHVSAAERAAVTAVIGTVLEQESALLGHAPGSRISAWQQSQRPMRSPIRTGQQQWARPGL